MPNTFYTCSLEWTGAANGPTVDTKSFSRDIHIQFPGGQPLEASSAPEYLGDAARTNPEELFITSVSSCHMLTYLFEAGRAGVKVTAYSDNPVGELGLKDGRMRIIRVTLKPVVTITSDSDATKANELMERAHRNCFIANSIACEWAIEPTFQIAE